MSPEIRHAAIAVLEDAIAALRENDAEVWAVQVSVESGRDATRLVTVEMRRGPKPHILDVSCSFCGANPGQECRTHGGEGVVTEPHSPRRKIYSDRFLGRDR